MSMPCLSRKHCSILQAMKNHYKSLAVFMTKSVSVQETDTGAVIKDVVIIQQGVDKVGDYIDEAFVDGIIAMGNSQPQGVKSRFGHPNMCKDSLGTYLGRYRNFRKSEDGHAIADLHLDKSAIKSPEGDLYSYVLDMARSNHDMFGNSIVFAADAEPIELEGSTYNRLILQSFIASDLVDSPAATTSLFRSTEDIGSALTEFIDEHPQVLSLLEDGKLVKSFFGRYATYFENKHKTKFNMGLIDKIKSALAGKKNIDITLADGIIATIVTEEAEPQVGDSVTIDGSPVADADHVAADGTIITTEGGVITAITPPAVDPPAEEVVAEGALSTEQMEKAVSAAIAKALKPLTEQLQMLSAKQAETEEALLMIATRTKSEGAVPARLNKSTSDPLTKNSIYKPVSKTKQKSY